jgi:hypothetical protein
MLRPPVTFSRVDSDIQLSFLFCILSERQQKYSVLTQRKVPPVQILMINYEMLISLYGMYNTTAGLRILVEKVRLQSVSET